MQKPTKKPTRKMLSFLQFINRQKSNVRKVATKTVAGNQINHHPTAQRVVDIHRATVLDGGDVRAQHEAPAR